MKYRIQVIKQQGQPDFFQPQVYIDEWLNLIDVFTSIYPFKQNLNTQYWSLKDKAINVIERYKTQIQAIPEVTFEYIEV